MKSTYQKNKQIQQKGFSLVELIVVIAIFVIISSVTLFKQSKFSSDILITNTAYEIALAIREAQVFGSGSKQGGEVSENRSKSFGVFFGSNEEQTFLLFSELPIISEGLKVYSSAFDPDDENFSIEEEIRLNRDQRINDFCVISGTEDVENSEKCKNQGEIEGLSISFVKPNLNPVIKGHDGTDIELYDSAKIIVESDLGDKCRTVIVNSVGQISVEAVASGESGCND